MEYLHTLLRPLIDTYTFSAYSLRKIVGRSLSERDLVNEILGEIKTNIDRGTVNYGALDTFRVATRPGGNWEFFEPEKNPFDSEFSF